MNLTLSNNCDTCGIDRTNRDPSGVSKITNAMRNPAFRNDSGPPQEDQRTLKSDHPVVTINTNQQNTVTGGQQLPTGTGHQEKQQEQKHRNHGRQQQHEQEPWCS